MDGGENSSKEAVHGAMEKVYGWYQQKLLMKALTREQFNNEKGVLMYRRREKDAQGIRVARKCSDHKVQKWNDKEADINEELQSKLHKVRYIRK